jgi:hypothetical protein
MKIESLIPFVQVCKELELPYPTLDTWCRKGHLKKIKVGPGNFISKTEYRKLKKKREL